MRNKNWWLCALLLAGACGGSSSKKDGGVYYGGGGANGSAAPTNPLPPGRGIVSGSGGSGAAGAMGGMNSGDKVMAVGTNPFISTQHDPFSTFGADVDTASYDIFRRDVLLGMVPRADGVRLEEYVNYFSYEYPAPGREAKDPFAISLAAASNVFDRPTMLVRVGIQATKPPPFEKRPANIVFLIDVSGSMHSDDKLPLVKKVAIEALSVLDPNDKISVVTYASGTGVALPPTPASDRPRITNLIQALDAGGSTAGSAGLTLAYQQAQAGFIEGGINHIILCTDGDFNVGPSSNTELLAQIREQRKTGVTMTALGFGIGNLNDSMMEAVSNAGNGIYGFIGDAQQASRYAHERLLATIDHVAKDLKIQVELNPAKVAAYRLLGYEDRLIDSHDFRNDAIDAGEIGAGHRVTALYELLPVGNTLPTMPGQPAIVDGPASDLQPEIGANDLILVKVRYKPTTATDATPAFEVATALDANHVEETLGAADTDLQWAAAIAAFAEILKQSPFASRGLLPQIEQIVNAQASRDADRAEFASLFAKIKPRL